MAQIIIDDSQDQKNGLEHRKRLINVAQTLRDIINLHKYSNPAEIDFSTSGNETIHKFIPRLQRAGLCR